VSLSSVVDSTGVVNGLVAADSVTGIKALDITATVDRSLLGLWMGETRFRNLEKLGPCPMTEASEPVPTKGCVANLMDDISPKVMDDRLSWRRGLMIDRKLKVLVKWKCPVYEGGGLSARVRLVLLPCWRLCNSSFRDNECDEDEWATIGA